MPKTRKRRIAGRIMIAVVTCALLLGAYVGSFGVAEWLHGRGAVSSVVVWRLHSTVYAPLILYGGPGSEAIQKWRAWFFLQGMGSPVAWDQMRVETSTADTIAIAIDGPDPNVTERIQATITTK